MSFLHPFKAKKEAAAQALHDEQQTVENKIDVAIDAARQLEDPAARVLQFARVEAYAFKALELELRQAIWDKGNTDDALKAVKADPHFIKLGEKYAQASALSAEEIEKNLMAVALSPLYADVAKQPGLAKKFADAAAKHLVAEDAAAKAAAEQETPAAQDQETPAVPVEAKAAEETPAPRAKPTVEEQKSKWSHITKLGH